ncbi:MAG: metal ABC transporter permease [Pirellulales bacterium]
MELLENWNWLLDGWIVAAGVLCAVASALVGNFLVLRKMSMLGDAISHAVLPGLAAAFFLTSSRDSLPMFVGAAIVGVLTALFTESIRRFGKVDEGAAMGVVFTALFAAGLVMIVQAADRVDLDPGCVLYGAIEMTPLYTVTVGQWEIPRVVLVLGAVMLVNLLAVVLFYKEFKIASFDPALATALGFNDSIMHYLLTTLVAITAVASFEAVGNILVVAMLIVPPATAYLCTDRLRTMIVISVIVAALAAILGHVGAIVVPRLFGYHSTTTSGMMATMAGLLFAVAVLFAPRQGIVVGFLRRGLLSLRILAEDVLALLYRAEEQSHASTVMDRNAVRRVLGPGSLRTTTVLGMLLSRGELVRGKDGFSLTDRGRDRAKTLVRSHRLWERYLATAAGIVESRIHGNAEQLEHYTDHELRGELDREMAHPAVDPHGKPIPPE